MGPQNHMRYLEMDPKCLNIAEDTEHVLYQRFRFAVQKTALGTTTGERFTPENIGWII